MREQILFEDNVCVIGISIYEKPINSADCKSCEPRYIMWPQLLIITAASA